MTEQVTGVDLVEARLPVAAGEPLPWRAERPAVAGARPVAGPSGPGIRLECGVAAGVEVSVHYDPLLARLIGAWPTARRPSRTEAALAGFRVDGVATVITFHERVIASAAVRAGEPHTQMVEQGVFNA